MEQHYLASANSCQGFKNYFSSINPAQKHFTYILKGGSGTGKSSLMKKIGKEAINKGYSVEYFYCSSDPESLDGVKIIEKNLAIVDGTAPHIVEASELGIKEKILNVGEFLSSKIQNYAWEIEKLLKEKSKHFELAFSYLSVLEQLLESEKLEYHQNPTFFKENNEMSYETLLQTLNSKKQRQNETLQRTLFASYIHKGGIKYIYERNNYSKIINLNNDIFTGAEILNRLKDKLCSLNYKFITFSSIYNPNLIEGILIEKSNTLILAYDYKKPLKFKNIDIINKLIKTVGHHIEMARKYHKKVEKYYIASMKFDELMEYTNKLIQEIFS